MEGRVFDGKREWRDAIKVNWARAFRWLAVFFFFPPESLPLFCLFSLSLSSHNQSTDRQTGAVMDDALSESDNIFSQSPKPDRTESAVG